MWQPISTAPYGRDLQLAVFDGRDMHALVFPCRRALGGWINARTQSRIDVRPTHWRDWKRTSEPNRPRSGAKSGCIG